MIIETQAGDYSALLGGHAPRTFRLPDTAIAPLETLDMLASLAARVGAHFSPAAWLIVEADEVVGLCCITRPPADGVVDIGYGVAPSRRGCGVMGRAIADILTWAQRTPDVAALTAETQPDNVPSQSVLKRNGFTQVGERVDAEDGPLLCWRCPTP